MFLVTTKFTIEKNIKFIKFSSFCISEKKSGNQRTELQKIADNKSIYHDGISDQVNRMRRFQWYNYPPIHGKKGKRNDKQKLPFRRNNQNNWWYGLRGMYKFGGEGIFGHITMIE